MTPHDRAWLSAYLDGELADESLQVAREHLATCPDCAAELEQLRQLRSLVQESLASVPTPSEADFARRVMARLPDRPARPGLWWWVPPLVVLALSAFAQAVVAVSSALVAAGRLGPLAGISQALSRWFPIQGFGPQLPDLSTGLSESAWWVESLRSLAIGMGISFVGLMIVGLVLWSWLAGWHALERHTRLRYSQFGTKGG
jgi:hypothetical protein